MAVFNHVDTSLKFPSLEAEVLAFWKQNDIFHKSLKQREGKPTWVFYEGPPTANGKPHPGHVLTRVVKDLFPRYKTMCGYRVPRKAGWDTHGLPVEVEVEKELKISGKNEIEAYGVEKFVRKCIDSVFRYTDTWEELTQRIGFWIDLPEAYVTYHQSYVESVWWSLQQLFERELLYQGHKILPWCPRCRTALSSHEVGQGYKEVEDPSVFVTFRDVDWEKNKTSFLAWTTTPWTLPSNAGLAVKADTLYAHVEVVPGPVGIHGPISKSGSSSGSHSRSVTGSSTGFGTASVSGHGERLIMALDLVRRVMGNMNYKVVKTELGSALIGRRYQPLFDWVWRQSETENAFIQRAMRGNNQLTPEMAKQLWIENVAADKAKNERWLKDAWKVCAADFVTLDAGAGIVHIAPAFGADDYGLGQKEGLPTIQLVDAGGNFTPECGAFAGRFVKDADNDIVKDLRARGLLLKREGYKHDYPFCWRCDSPLIYFARECWFIRTTREIGHVIENNKTVHWIPGHIREGRFGNFLESNVDWALSRERYWGTPLPIWKCPGCHYQEAVGSLDELRGKEGVEGLDVFDKAKAADPGLNEHLRIHKPWIDAVEYDCPVCSLRLKRVPEVIDCWYDSGAMPYAQWGYPHAPGSKEEFAEAFPADFISEAIDQTRGWFYSLIAESTLLGESFGKASGAKAPYPHPFKTCVVLGHVCDEKGEKMSKHKGNYLDPSDILNEEGADALRWFFYSCNHPWTSARFSRGAVRESQKEFLIKLWNVYSFFAIYANLDGFDPERGRPARTGNAEAAGTAAVHGHGGGFRGGRPLSARGEMDRWILSELHHTVKEIRERLDDYDIFDAAAALSAFADCLSNWYVQRSRDRYWRSWKSADRSAPEDQDKLDCYWTLYECLVTTAQLMAPFVPFMAEAIWRNLAVKPLGSAVPKSVHLCDYPAVDAEAMDEKLSAEMALIREIVSLGRNVRSLQKLKVRLPLPKVIIVLADPSKTEVVKRHEEVLLDALNVKQVEFAVGAEQFVNYALKPNFKAIGAKHRERVPAIKKALAEADAAKLRVELDRNGSCTIDAGGHAVKLETDDVEVTLSAREGYAAASGRQEVVVLDTHVTPELLEEGFARELVFRVNGFRGELNLKYEQRIKLAVKGGAKLEEVARKFQSYICGETLATELRTGETPDGWKMLEIDVEGEKGVLALEA